MTQRQRLLQALKDFSSLYPHWRLGQTLENVGSWAMQNEFCGSFNVEDEKLASTAWEHFNRRKEAIELGSNRTLTPLSPLRAELFHVLEKLDHMFPDCSFAQLVFMIARWADVNIWDVEDEQLLNAAKKHLEGSLQFDTAAKG